MPNRLHRSHLNLGFSIPSIRSNDKHSLALFALKRHSAKEQKRVSRRTELKEDDETKNFTNETRWRVHKNHSNTNNKQRKIYEINQNRICCWWCLEPCGTNWACNFRFDYYSLMDEIELNGDVGFLIVSLTQPTSLNVHNATQRKAKDPYAERGREIEEESDGDTSRNKKEIWIYALRFMDFLCCFGYGRGRCKQILTIKIRNSAPQLNYFGWANEWRCESPFHRSARWCNGNE